MDQKVYKVVQHITKKLVAKNGFLTFSKDTGYHLRKIHGATRIHSDGIGPRAINGKEFRNISLIMALNSNYEGGVFKFPLQNLELRLEQGDIICFPVYATHPHEVSAPTNGVRYTINTWLLE